MSNYIDAITAIETSGTGTTYRVESVGGLRQAIEAAQDGDTIVMAAGDYTVYGTEYRWDEPEAAALREEAGFPHDERSWNTGQIGIDKSLTFSSDGGQVNLTATSAVAKGIFTIYRDVETTVVDGFGFFGSKAKWNASSAGIRHQGGDLTVRDSTFGDNNNGILSQAVGDTAGNVVIENSEFYGSGNAGLQHNIYVYSKSLSVTDSYFHDVTLGHHIKSLADTTIIRDNIIDDGDTPAGRAVDVTGGGDLLIEGNHITKSANADNREFFYYSAMRKGGEFGEIRIADNTIVNEGKGNPGFLYNDSDVIARIENNVIVDPLMEVTTPADLVKSGRSVQTGNTLDDAPLPDFDVGAQMVDGTSGDDAVSLGWGVWYDAGDGDDVVYTGHGADRVFGAEGEDILVAAETPGSWDGKRADALFGGPGGDLLAATNGQHNLLVGDGGHDVLISDTPQGNLLYGGTGNDLLYGGGSGRKYLNGGPGDDVLVAEASTKKPHRLMAGDGDDIILGSGGPVDYSGGAGIDTAIYYGNFADYAFYVKWGVELRIRTDNPDLFHQFHRNAAERADGYSHDHTLPADLEKLQFADGVYDIASETFTPGAQIADLEAIRDAIAAAQAAIPDRPETVVESDGGVANPTPDSKSTSEPAPKPTPEPTSKSPDQQPIRLEGTSGDDVFHWEDVDGTIKAVDGGDGFDVMAMRRDWLSLDVDLRDAELTSIERLEGGISDDVVHGSAGDDVIVGGGTGRYGDELFGHGGDDVFVVAQPEYGGAPTRVDGGAGHDTVRGTDGDDVIMLRDFSIDRGVEVVDAGAGADVLTGNKAWLVHHIDLRGVEVRGLERIRGGDKDDVLHGSAAGEIIDGRGGDDVVSGGGGADSFVVDLADGGHDRIVDFSPGNDRLVLDAEALATLYPALATTGGDGAAGHVLVERLFGREGWTFRAETGEGAMLLHPGGSIEFAASDERLDFADIVEALIFM